MDYVFQILEAVKINRLSAVERVDMGITSADVSFMEQRLPVGT